MYRRPAEETTDRQTPPQKVLRAGSTGTASLRSEKEAVSTGQHVGTTTETSTKCNKKEQGIHIEGGFIL
jgi:hypothetical protein